MQWLFIGAGNMAGSLIGGLLASDSGTSRPLVFDPSSDAIDAIGKRHDVQASTDLPYLLREHAEADALGVVLAVKPDVVKTACTEFGIALKNTGLERALVLSVAAGVRIEALEAWLPDGLPIARCMPNTPALLGFGASGIHATGRCSEQDRAHVQALLETAGLCRWVSTEAKLDAVTAVSGSGPAYFFRLVELMSRSGQELGLDEDESLDLAIETAYGAACMMRQRDNEPGVLRERVTSKGGTTAAALQQFEELGMTNMVSLAMNAARDRAIALGDEFFEPSSD